MRNFLFIALIVLLTGSIGRADTCPDLRLDGTWKMENQPTFFSYHWRTYKITQSGCYVLVYDTYRKATWKVDLSGQHKIRVPAEQVQANLNGGGASAAKNISNLEVTLTPKGSSTNYYLATLTADPYLEEQKSFPVSMKAHFEMSLSITAPDQMCPPVCSSNSGSIKVNLRDFQVLDITKGLPGNIDKSSFLTGLNTVANMFVKAFSYKLTALTLLKDQ